MNRSWGEVGLIGLLFVSAGASVMIIFISAHEEVLERELSKQAENARAPLLSNADGNSSRWVSPTVVAQPGPRRISGSRKTWHQRSRIEGNKIIFEPILKGKLESSVQDGGLANDLAVSPVENWSILKLVAQETLRFYDEFGPFDYDVREIAVVFKEGHPSLSKNHADHDSYVLRLTGSEFCGATVREVAHEVTHLKSPFLISWYAEGLCEIRASETLDRTSFDLDGRMEFQIQTFNPNYARAQSLMRQLEAVVGREHIFSMLDMSMRRSSKTYQFSRNSRVVNIDRWLDSLPKEKQRQCREIVNREGRLLLHAGHRHSKDMTITIPFPK